ncbi:MAG: NAD(P)/FAD-dependent oxidoreductase, partial [Gammaproteobacteria bacterium]
MRIAIIGAGVSGLYAAHLLHAQHDIEIFEAGRYPGGHTNTVDAEVDGKIIPVDTGFIVYNEPNYPLFTNLLQELGVATQNGEMSFSMSCQLSGLEYNGSNLNTLFAQRSNLVKPGFYKMLMEIMRFNKLADELINSSEDLKLGDFLGNHGFSGPAVDDYLVPMAAAIWSSDPAHILDYPAAWFGQFFRNHGLLSVNDRPQWQTILNGSRNYVEKIIVPFKQRLHLSTPVKQVSRHNDGVDILTDAGTERFDEVIFACHSNQALTMLAEPTDNERDILGAIPYQANDTVLHTDSSLMPQRRLAWASWNYHRFASEEREVCMTYNMSLLQQLDSPKPL